VQLVAAIIVHEISTAPSALAQASCASCKIQYHVVNFFATWDFQILHSGVLPTVSVYYKPITRTGFWRLLICFVIKLENIQVVNYVETTVEWYQRAVADSDSE